jgi:membrane protein DedA with SNARE-associated domain
VIETVHQTLLAHAWGGLLLVALMAWLEYVFPPVPGDSTMLLACFLAGAGSLPLSGTILACFAGSALGAATSYAIGARLGRSYFFLRSAWAKEELLRFERALARFGPRLLIANRFLPGIRAVFLYGAGIGRLPARPALAYATISNALWVGFIAWAGSALGSSWEEVQVVFRRYVYAIAAGMTVYVVWGVLRARRRRRAGL